MAMYELNTKYYNKLTKKEIQEILKTYNIVYKKKNYYSYTVKYENKKYYKCTNGMSGYKPNTLTNIEFFMNSKDREYFVLKEKN